MPGKLLFLFVGLFGAFTVLFGLSTTVWLSIPALALVGASDMVSVTIRETIMQLWTPDEVRGRVNAVNRVFIGASNELGEFRAGTVAHLIGPVPAVVIGGVGAIAVAVHLEPAVPGPARAAHARPEDGRGRRPRALDSCGFRLYHAPTCRALGLLERTRDSLNSGICRSVPQGRAEEGAITFDDL